MIKIRITVDIPSLSERMIRTIEVPDHFTNEEIEDAACDAKNDLLDWSWEKFDLESVGK